MHLHDHTLADAPFCHIYTRPRIDDYTRESGERDGVSVLPKHCIYSEVLTHGPWLWEVFPQSTR